MVILAVYASIVLAKVAGQHYLIQQETSLVLIGGNKRHMGKSFVSKLKHHNSLSVGARPLDRTIFPDTPHLQFHITVVGVTGSEFILQPH